MTTYPKVILRRFKHLIENEGLTPTAACTTLGFSKRHMRPLAEECGLDDLIRPQRRVHPSMAKPLKAAMKAEGISLNAACRRLNYPSRAIYYHAVEWGLRDPDEPRSELDRRYAYRLDEVRALLKARRNVAEVARILGAPYDSFLRFVRRHGLGRFIRKSEPEYLPEERKLAIAMFKRGAKLREIAAALGRASYIGLPTLLRRWMGDDYKPRRVRRIHALVSSPPTVAAVHVPPSLDGRELVRRAGANTWISATRIVGRSRSTI